MIENSVLKMLTDRNPEIRKQGVKLLAQTKSMDALPHLATVYRTDNDADVREMARKAGFYIRKQAGRPSASNNSSWEKISQDAMVQTDIEDAIEFAKQGDSERAATKLAQALEYDPDLESHPKVIRIAEHLTGLKGTPAVRDVIDFAFGSSYASGNLYEDPDEGSSSLFDDYDDGSASSFIASSKLDDAQITKQKKKKNTQQQQLSGWGQVGIDLAIYTLISVGGFIGIIIIVTLRFNPIIDAITPDSGLISLRDFIQGGMIAYIGFTVVSAIGYTIGLMFFGLLIHLASDMFLYGDGSYTRLMHKITPYSTIIAVVNFVMIGIMIFMLPDPNTFLNGNVFGGDAYILEANQAIQSFNALLTLFSFATFVYYGKVIGDAYRFGMYKGCLSMFMVFCFFIALFCCIFVAASSTLNSAA